MTTHDRPEVGNYAYAVPRYGKWGRESAPRLHRGVITGVQPVPHSSPPDYRITVTFDDVPPEWDAVQEFYLDELAYVTVSTPRPQPREDHAQAS